MESLFHSLDCRSNPTPGFWQIITDDNQEEVFSNVICSGTLQMTLPLKGLKMKKFVLTKSHIYCLSRWGQPKIKSNINWKILEPFEEIHSGISRYGFRLQGNDFEDFYTNSIWELNKWLSKLYQVCILNSFEEDFIVIKELSKGASCIVKLCQSSEGYEEFAVKTVNKELFLVKPATFENIVSEVSVLRNIDHPNVVKIFRVYESEDAIHIVLEYLAGGDAQKRFSKMKKLDEKTALKFVFKVLATLDFLHSKSVVHRDIKLENIAFTDETFENFKIIDFGLSSKSTESMNEKCGTVGYIAPEILKGSLYNEKIDIFSTGVMLYILLTGKSLFTGKTLNEILMKNKAFQEISTSTLKTIKFSTRKLLISMLRPDPLLRVSIQEAMSSPCFREVLGADYLYISNETNDSSFYEKGNTTDTVNKSPLSRYNIKNNNYVHPL
jgi:hypothetical protein